MKKITLFFLLLFFSLDAISQYDDFIKLDIKEDTSLSFFNHISCDLVLKQPDSLVFFTRFGRFYIEGKVGDHGWIIMDPLPSVYIETYLDAGPHSAYAASYQIFKQLDSVEVVKYMNQGALLELRYKAIGGFYNTNTPATSFEETGIGGIYLSNIDTVHLRPANSDDINAFFTIRNRITTHDSFVWVNQEKFTYQEKLVLAQIASDWPKSVLSDIALYYMTVYEFARRQTAQGLSATDRQELNQALNELSNSTKSQFIKSRIKSNRY